MRLLLALLGSLVPAVALADEVTPPAPTSVAAAAPDADATVVAHTLPPTDRAYGEKWSREAGVSAGLMAAPGVYAATISPQFGWFIADHLEISTIVSLTRLFAGMESATVATAILEPSYHYQIDHKTQMFAGMGFGYAYLSDQGHGATYAVRGGIQFVVGRGILAPTISYELRTQEEKLGAHSLAYLATHNALRLNFGYTSIF